MKQLLKACLLLLLASCSRTEPDSSLVLIRIQDRNGFTDTISAEEKLQHFSQMDFLTPQPYQKVVRVFREYGKNSSILTTYYPNGEPYQYLEAKEMRAHGMFCEWFAGGQMKLQAHVIGGIADLTPAAQESWLFDGEARAWNEEGHLIASMYYDKGTLSGVSSTYYPSGKLQNQMTYDRGHLEGEAVEFWESGQTKSRGTYLFGQKSGLFMGHWPNGNLMSEEDYERGLIKQAKYWSPRGELVGMVDQGYGFMALFKEELLTDLIEIRRGAAEGVVKTFDPQGRPKSQFHVKNGVKHGEEITYYVESEAGGKVRQEPLPKLSISWDNNAIHGAVKTWYDNGQLQSQREYCRNVRSGIACSWYRDGAFMLMEEYEDGLLRKGQYYRKHQKEPVSSIVSGNGLATLYDAEGVFLKKVHYSKGKPTEPEEP